MKIDVCPGDRWIERVERSKLIQTNLARRRILHELNSLSLVRLMWLWAPGLRHLFLN